MAIQSPIPLDGNKNSVISNLYPYNTLTDFTNNPFPDNLFSNWLGESMPPVPTRLFWYVLLRSVSNLALFEAVWVSNLNWFDATYVWFIANSPGSFLPEAGDGNLGYEVVSWQRIFPSSMLYNNTSQLSSLNNSSFKKDITNETVIKGSGDLNNKPDEEEEEELLPPYHEISGPS